MSQHFMLTSCEGAIGRHTRNPTYSRLLYFRDAILDVKTNADRVVALSEQA